jgi:hypothetical protein
MDSRPLTLRGVVKREGEYWASIVLDFNIVGTGDTAEDAVASSLWMTKAYLEERCAAGETVESLKRAAPVSVKARYHLANVASHASAARGRRGREKAMPFERRVFVVCAA